MSAALTDYLLLAAVVFGVNLLPAFGPPTWAVLVFLRLRSDLDLVPTVVVGATAAAAGRFVLAHAARRFRGRISLRRRRHLAAARTLLVHHRVKSIVGLGLFAVSPVPSAQLFVSAGLMELPLVPLTAAFFAGRLVSYTLFVGAAASARRGFGSLLDVWLRWPLGIALEGAMLVGLVLLVRVDWTHVLARRQRRKRRVPRG